MTKGYIRKPGDTAWTLTEINGYDDLNKLVGGFIELVPVGGDFTLYCHEEGELRNLQETAVWMYNGKPWDVLVGPLVLVGPPDEEGDDTDATPEMIFEVSKHLRYL